MFLISSGCADALRGYCCISMPIMYIKADNTKFNCLKIRLITQFCSYYIPYHFSLQANIIFFTRNSSFNIS